MKTIMRGFASGDLVFFFDDGKAVGLDLYRDWLAAGGRALKPGEEIKRS